MVIPPHLSGIVYWDSRIIHVKVREVQEDELYIYKLTIENQKTGYRESTLIVEK